MTTTYMIGELWFVTRKQRDRYLTWMGYLFEQSIPTHGVSYGHWLTELNTTDRLHKLVQSV